MLDALPPFPTRPHDPPSSLRAVAFHLPQYHPTPENDAFWGPGFTEWRNVVRAAPRFPGHAQPHLPADLGFYDLRLAEIREAQANLARAAGLSGFCYYHYWFGGRRVLNAPFDAVLASGEPDFPFMLCWANENWTRAWDGGEREILLAQSYSDDDTAAHARHLAPAFADPRYIRVERWLDRDRRPPAALGFDAALEFQPFSRSFRRWLATRPDLKAAPGRRIAHRLRREASRLRPLDTHHDLSAFVAFDTARPHPAYRCFPGVCPSWDNSARRPPGRAIIFRRSSPALFRDWVAARARAARSSGEENLLFVNAWNEWAEGNHLEPCLAHGHGWLEALRAGIDASTTAVSRGPGDCWTEATGQ